MHSYPESLAPHVMPHPSLPATPPPPVPSAASRASPAAQSPPADDLGAPHHVALRIRSSPPDPLRSDASGSYLGFRDAESQASSGREQAPLMDLEPDDASEGGGGGSAGGSASGGRSSDAGGGPGAHATPEDVATSTIDVREHPEPLESPSVTGPKP